MNPCGTEAFGKEIFEAVTVELNLNVAGKSLRLTDVSVQYLSSINTFQIVPCGPLGTTDTNF